MVRKRTFEGGGQVWNSNCGEQKSMLLRKIGIYRQSDGQLRLVAMNL